MRNISKIFGTTVAAALVVALGAGAVPADAKKAKRPAAHAYADAEPRARIRGVAPGHELTPIEFAQWLRVQSPRLLSAAGEPGLQQVSMKTRLLNRTSDEFREADADANGRVSPEEIASMIARRAAYSATI